MFPSDGAERTIRFAGFHVNDESPNSQKAQKDDHWTICANHLEHLKNGRKRIYELRLVAASRQILFSTSFGDPCCLHCFDPPRVADERVARTAFLVTGMGVAPFYVESETPARGVEWPHAV